MKRYLILTLVALTALLSCGKGSGDPVSKARDFMNAVDHFKFDKARTMVTENYSPMLDNIEKFFNSKSESQKAEYLQKVAERKYNYLLSTRSDTAASVIVTGDSKSDKTVVIEFGMVKKGGKWLIDSQSDE